MSEAREINFCKGFSHAMSYQSPSKDGQYNGTYFASSLHKGASMVELEEPEIYSLQYPQITSLHDG